MNIQVNDAGIIINRMGHPLDARKVCESHNELLAALHAVIAACTEPSHPTLERATNAHRIARAAIAKAQP